jgi:hypothetical protein
MISLSPKVCNLLIQTTKSNDIDTALHSVLSEYIQMKLIDLEKKREIFETKWQGEFSQFQEKIKNNNLGKDPYSYEVESDYWEREDTHTLLEHYESIKRGKEKMDLCFFLIAKGLWLNLVRQAWLVSLPNNITSSLRYENCELCYMY